MILKRKNRRFSIMVAGRKGSGKSLFFNTFFNDNLVQLQPCDDINMFMLSVDCEGVSQKISLIDTPGLNGSVKDEDLQSNLVDFIKNQFDTYMNEESKIRRSADFEDPRVHCLLYFIPCSSNGLTQNDIVFLQKTCHLVNIIPILSKADGLCIDEKQKLKQKIITQINDNKISVFDFEHPDYCENVSDQCLNSLMPFCIISCDEDDVTERVRKSKWGDIEIDNIRHCDFAILKEILLGSHLKMLIDYTSSELYEAYRADMLEQRINQI